MSERVFGDIPGYPKGSLFGSRAELSLSGVHRPPVAGISGSARDGADSIVLSGGYEDDEDFGDVIVYTGHGGRDPQTGQQVGDQNFTRGNRALAVSGLNGLPVRVIRGASHDSPHAPPGGYSYDGLFLVEDYWHERGLSGFRVWRFRLRGISAPALSVGEERVLYGPVPRCEVSVSRIVRDTALTREVKHLYAFRCQVCRARLEGIAGPYAEAAHIRPLGRPHDGPDAWENILCLCPNHHVLFDHGGLTIGDDLSLTGWSGRLSVHRRHDISRQYLRYRRAHFGAGP